MRTFFIFLLVTLSCCKTRTEKLKSDGWELAGEIDGCKLYKKTEGIEVVYWSVCTKEGNTATVSRH